MRIIGGSHKRLKLITPDDLTTRPTSDRARQSLFDCLSHGLSDFLGEGDPFLTKRFTTLADLCAGSGALGLEALSRGASFAHFIENSPPALTCLRANIRACRFPSPPPTQIHPKAWQSFTISQPLSLIVFDPPYDNFNLQEVLSLCLHRHWLAKDGLLVCQSSRGSEIEKQWASLSPSFPAWQLIRILPSAGALFSIWIMA